MVEPSRYSVSDKEAGIENGILINKLGINNQQELNDAETLLLVDTYEYFLNSLLDEKIDFNTELILRIHKYFLGTLYSWAGQLRAVDISKDNMLFAPAAHLQKSFGILDDIIYDNLPSDKDSKKIVAQKIAVIHNEFNAVHPFREGNGRTIRLFLDLLSVSLGFGQ